MHLTSERASGTLRQHFGIGDRFLALQSNCSILVTSRVGNINKINDNMEVANPRLHSTVPVGIISQAAQKGFLKIGFHNPTSHYEKKSMFDYHSVY